MIGAGVKTTTKTWETLDGRHPSRRRAENAARIMREYGYRQVRTISNPDGTDKAGRPTFAVQVRIER